MTGEGQATDVARTIKPGADLPVGTEVLAWPGSRDDCALLTVTRTPVWETYAGDLLVSVRGYVGGIALTHIEVLPARDNTPGMDAS